MPCRKPHFHVTIPRLLYEQDSVPCWHCFIDVLSDAQGKCGNAPCPCAQLFEGAEYVQETFDQAVAGYLPSCLTNNCEGDERIILSATCLKFLHPEIVQDYKLLHTPPRSLFTGETESPSTLVISADLAPRSCLVWCGAHRLRTLQPKSTADCRPDKPGHQNAVIQLRRCGCRGVRSILQGIYSCKDFSDFLTISAFSGYLKSQLSQISTDLARVTEKV